MSDKGGKAGSGAAGQDDKARRLAEALRQNLRRRKAQSRARATEAASGNTASGDTAPADTALGDMDEGSGEGSG